MILRVLSILWILKYDEINFLNDPIAEIVWQDIQESYKSAFTDGENLESKTV